MGCEYGQKRAAQSTRNKFPDDARPFLLSFKCEPNPFNSPSSLVVNEDSLSSNIVTSETGSRVPSSTRSTLSSFSSENPHCLEPEESPVHQKKTSPETQLVSFKENLANPCQQCNTPTFSFLPSLHLSFVPRPLNVSFPLINPEYFQISGTTFSELDLSLYVFPPSGCSPDVTGTNPVLSVDSQRYED